MKGRWWLPLLILYFSLLSACQNMAEDNKAQGQMPDSTRAGEIQIESINTNMSYTERRGKILFDQYCSVCHGSTGKGDGFNAYNLNPKPKDLTKEEYWATLSDTWLFEVISQGGRGAKRSVLMPSYEKTLTQSQIQDLVDYLRVLQNIE